MCVPGTMLYYDMIDKCRLTCGLCDPWMGAREKMNEVNLSVILRIFKSFVPYMISKFQTAVI